MTSRQAACALERVHAQHRDFRRRLVAISGRFINTPFRLDALGEGPGGTVDRDPLFSLYRVDCQTFVETLVALAHAPRLDLAPRVLSQVRYRDGRVHYKARHHFPTSQWIPLNGRLGVVRDVTATIVPGAKLRVLTVKVGPRSWRGKFRKFARLGSAAPSGVYQLPVLPLDVAIANAHRFPNGALLNTVRVPHRAYPEPISHQGFIAVVNGRRVVRQATQLGKYPRVVEYPLRDYLVRSRAYYRRAPRPMLGVNVQLITESPRLRKLVARELAKQPAARACAQRTGSQRVSKQ
ncbi:MAG: DUF1460 domain-containing protein [Myxococcales bacterium]|nr:DUF1460 domain-containing protein [Myxococcales bacterium]